MVRWPGREATEEDAGGDGGDNLPDLSPELTAHRLHFDSTSRPPNAATCAAIVPTSEATAMAVVASQASTSMSAVICSTKNGAPAACVE